jgi:Icc-related predicted phosphoesterase
VKEAIGESVSTRRVARIAAVADLHCGRDAPPLGALFTRATAEADVLLLCGDLVDHGLPDEARLLAREIATSVGVPTLAVLGNHDFESGHEQEICAILGDVGVRILDGDSYEVAGVGIAGVKGFAGGFGRHTLGAWGEAAIKNFVREAIDETLKLEAALSKLHSGPRIAMLHYSPITATLEGEAPEIYPFLGTSRLEEPLNRFAVDAVFHGHAHPGAAEGRTAAGIPVYNVSVPVMRRAFPDHPPYRLIEVEIAGGDEAHPQDGAAATRSAP